MADEFKIVGSEGAGLSISCVACGAVFHIERTDDTLLIVHHSTRRRFPMLPSGENLYFDETDTMLKPRCPKCGVRAQTPITLQVEETDQTTRGGKD